MAPPKKSMKRGESSQSGSRTRSELHTNSEQPSPERSPTSSFSRRSRHDLFEERLPSMLGSSDPLGPAEEIVTAPVGSEPADLNTQDNLEDIPATTIRGTSVPQDPPPSQSTVTVVPPSQSITTVLQMSDTTRASIPDTAGEN